MSQSAPYVQNNASDENLSRGKSAGGCGRSGSRSQVQQVRARHFAFAFLKPASMSRLTAWLPVQSSNVLVGEMLGSTRAGVKQHLVSISQAQIGGSILICSCGGEESRLQTVCSMLDCGTLVMSLIDAMWMQKLRCSAHAPVGGEHDSSIGAGGQVRSALGAGPLRQLSLQDLHRQQSCRTRQLILLPFIHEWDGHLPWPAGRNFHSFSLACNPGLCVVVHAFLDVPYAVNVGLIKTHTQMGWTSSLAWSQGLPMSQSE